MMKALKSFATDDRGVDLIEYALLAGLIVVVGSASLSSIGTKVAAMFVNLNTLLPAAP